MQNACLNKLQRGIQYFTEEQFKKSHILFQQVASELDPMGLYLFSVSLREGYAEKGNAKAGMQVLSLCIKVIVYILENQIATLEDLTAKFIPTVQDEETKKLILMLKDSTNVSVSMDDMEKALTIEPPIAIQVVSSPAENSKNQRLSRNRQLSNSIIDLGKNIMKNISMSSIRRTSTPTAHHQRVSGKLASFKVGPEVNLSGRVKNMVGLPAYELGLCYFFGWGTRKDKNLALYYFQIAATANDRDAIEQLAYMYEKGDGVKSSKLKAAKYYRVVNAEADQWYWKSKYSAKTNEEVVEADKDLLQLLKSPPPLKKSSWLTNCSCCQNKV